MAKISISCRISILDQVQVRAIDTQKAEPAWTFTDVAGGIMKTPVAAMSRIRFLLLVLLVSSCASGTAPLSFIAVGDTGTGSADQLAVAQAMHEKLLATNSAFIVLLGDNFYDTGVVSITDSQWETKFEDIYGDWGVPVYAVLGNHDYGGGAGAVDSVGQFQVDYSSSDTSWTMPDKFYSWTKDNALFLALDTNWLKMHAPSDAEAQRQTAFVDEAMAVDVMWKLVFGHHPYLSNGPHGNAGSYDGNTIDNLTNGIYFKDFIEAHILPEADVYLCGHDHSMQVLPAGSWNTLLCVSGGGSGALTLFPGSNPSYFSRSQFGFAWVEIDGSQLTKEMYGTDGERLYGQVLNK
jgi:hypothetical protein